MTVEEDAINPGVYKPFEYISRVDPIHLLNFIQHEHPQVIALILSYLKPKNASIILRNLPHEVQSDITVRITCMDRADPEILRKIERVLEKKLSTLSSEDYEAVGGVDEMVKILNLVGNTNKKLIIKTLDIENPEIAEKIKKRSSIFWKIFLKTKFAASFHSISI